MHADIGLGRSALERLLAGARRAVCFTGAGLSTECGVPDFRSPGSPWLTYQPIDFHSFMASQELRFEAWRRKFALDALCPSPKPGRGHKTIARLVARGRIDGVITQNIDGLHQASGLAADQLVELHGNGTYAKCLTCDRRYELAEVRHRFETERQAPNCDCGGPIKSATIAFGQAMPEAELRRARTLALSCDLFIVVGSSLVVYPAAVLPVAAKRNGARLVILNRTATGLDAMADLVIHADIGSVLDSLTVDDAPAQHYQH